MHVVQPTAMTTILDIGASGVASGERAENFLEEWYPYPEMITAVGIEDMKKFSERYPKVKAVQADARKLPFKDGEFDVVFSNAVIEHVGGRRDQEKFVSECLRVGKKVFLTTPARSFPIESHTMIPFVHWLPTFMRNRIYRSLGRKNEGKHNALTLLTSSAFKKLFPRPTRVKILRQRLFGLTSVLIAYADSSNQ